MNEIIGYKSVDKNYKDIRVRKDLSNNDRVVIMQKGE